MHIGFIGLGIMGVRMAANLQKKFPNLTVYNRDSKKADELLANGATVVSSPRELASNIDILITVLSTPQVVEEIACGPDGFLKHMKKDSLWIDSTTVNPSFSRHMAVEANKHAIRFIDAPVAGSKQPAQDGQLLFLVGGDKSDVDQAQPLFNAMGRKTLHVGNNGMGASMKMVINLLLGQSMMVFSEAINFGKKLGISENVLFDSLLDGPLVAPYLKSKKDKFTSGEYEVEFPLEWMQKDLFLATVTAQEVNAPLPSGDVAKQVFANAKRNGLSREDFSAIYKMYQEL